MPESMETLTRLRELYRAYLEQAEALATKPRLLAGAFGMRGGPADDPCHEHFAEDLRALLDGFAAGARDPDEARALLEEIFSASGRDCPAFAYWMLLAVHNLTEPVIGCLRSEDAQALYESYRKAFPRNRRLPAQDHVLRWLKQKI